MLCSTTWHCVLICYFCKFASPLHLHSLFPEEVNISDDTRCEISGCEFDYSSNTYRLMVILSAGSVTVGENFLIIKIDGATGYPKILSVK